MEILIGIVKSIGRISKKSRKFTHRINVNEDSSCSMSNHCRHCRLRTFYIYSRIESLLWRLFMSRFNWHPITSLWQKKSTKVSCWWLSYFSTSFCWFFEMFMLFLTASVTATAKAITTTHSKFRLHEKKQIYYSYL